MRERFNRFSKDIEPEYIEKRFVRLLYRHNVRNLCIIAVVFLLLCLDIILKWKYVGDDTAVVFICFAVTALLVGVCVTFILRPHWHPVYAQLKRLGDIEELEAEIDKAFLGQKPTLFASKFYGEGWYVRKRMFGSEIFVYDNKQKRKVMEIPVDKENKRK